MEFFVGLDVSLDETHVCVIDEGGRIVKEGRCPSEPCAIARAIRHQGRKIEHVGLETGGLSQWLFQGLTKEGFTVSATWADASSSRPASLLGTPTASARWRIGFVVVL